MKKNFTNFIIVLILTSVGATALITLIEHVAGPVWLFISAFVICGLIGFFLLIRDIIRIRKGE